MENIISPILNDRSFFFFLLTNLLPRSFFERKNARVKTSLFQALGQQGRSEKRAGNERVLFSLGFRSSLISLVPRPLF